MRSLTIGEIAIEPLQLYDGARRTRALGSTAGFVPRHRAAWSDFYRHTERTPSIVDPAPWVLKHYRARAPHRVREGGQ